MNRLKDKVAVVTGGANGLGEAIAQRLSDEGAAVAILDLSERGHAIAQGLQGDGRAAAFFKCDVTNEHQVRQAIDSTVERFGRLDTLVNNAGIEGLNRRTDELELAEWEQVMSVNVTGVFLCTKHAIPHLRRAGGGAIVNISSIYGLVGGGDVPPYHAAKGAVRTMSKNDALTYAPDRIRVNSVHPGFIVTSMTRRFAKDCGLEFEPLKVALDELHPLGGTGEPDDVAWGVVYLASDHAKWVTGTELVIDGGYTAR